MSYEVLLLMNRIKAEQAKQDRTAWIKKDAEGNSLDGASAEKLVVSDPCPLPDLRLFPNLKELSVSTMLDAEMISSMDFGNISSLSINVNPFSGQLKIHGSKLESVRICISEVDNRMPLIDGADHGVIDLSELPGLVAISLHHVSLYKVQLPCIPGLKSIRVFNSNNIDMSPVLNNTHIVHLDLADCDLDRTGFLDQFYNLEELDISYNRIKEAPEILKMSGLRSLCIRKNPLSDPESYRLPQLEKVIITEKDYRINSFAGMIKGVPYSAFSSIHRVRNPEKYTAVYL